MKQFSIIILLGMSFILAACADKVARSQTAKVTSKVNTSEENTQLKSNPTPTPKGNSSTENAGKCQPKNVSSSEGDSQNFDVDETILTPDSRKAFDDWLHNIFGAVQVATLANRKFINEYYWEGDLNADGCRDVAIIVQGSKDKSGVVSTENFATGTTVQNLRSKAIFKGGDAAKIPFSKAFALQIKPKQEIAVAIVFGGEKGWSWKHNAAGREFLLYDSIFKPSQVLDYEATSTQFSIVNRDKPEEDDDLLYRFPANAVGDCIYTATQIKRKKVKFSELSNKFLICFDGKFFFNKKLPDSKSYPE